MQTKNIQKGVACVLAVAVLGLAGTAAAAVEPGPATVWMNEDNEHFYHHPEADMSVGGCRKLVDWYCDTGAVTGILFCVNMQRALYDSEVWERFRDQPIETLDPAEHERTIEYVRRLRLLSERKVDQFGVWLARCRERGVAGWLTMRMNDAHGLEEAAFRYYLEEGRTTCKVSTWPSEKWAKHPEWRRAPYRREHSFESTYNFLVPEAFEHHLALVREIFSKWDMDGLELDWMRWIMHFPPGHEAEGRACLTRFVRETRHLADAAAARLGHPVRLGHRVPSDPDIAYKAGYDVAAWADAGCVDMLTVCDFMDEIPNDVPVWNWRRLVRPGTVVLCGISGNGYGSTAYGKLPADDALRFGRAMSAWACGADGVYSFNDCYGECSNRDWLANCLRTVSSPENIRKAGWRSVVSDIEGFPGYSTRAVLPAPLLIADTGRSIARLGQTLTLRLTTGLPAKDADVTLTLGFDEKTSQETIRALEVRVNGTVVKAVESVRAKCPGTVARTASYQVPSAVLRPRDNAIEIIPPQARTSKRHEEHAEEAGQVVWCDMSFAGEGCGKEPTR